MRSLLHCCSPPCWPQTLTEQKQQSNKDSARGNASLPQFVFSWPIHFLNRVSLPPWIITLSRHCIAVEQSCPHRPRALPPAAHNWFCSFSTLHFRTKCTTRHRLSRGRAAREDPPLVVSLSKKSTRELEDIFEAINSKSGSADARFHMEQVVCISSKRV